MAFEVVYHEQSRPVGLAGLPAFRKAVHRLNFGWGARRLFYDMLIENLREDNGSPLEVLIELYVRHLSRRGMTGRATAEVLTALHDEMHDHSQSFARSIRPLISVPEFAIIDAGEKGGELPSALESLISQRERINRMNWAYLKVFGLIAFYAVMIFGTIYFMAIETVPMLVPFAHMMSRRPNTSQVFLLGLTGWVQSTGPIWVVSVVLLLAAVILASLSRVTGKTRLYLEYLPPWSTYRATQGYIWLSTFLILVRAGVAETQVLQDQIQHASPWLRERLVRIENLMSTHALLLPAALVESGLNFPSPGMVDEIAIRWGGKQSGDDRLAKASERWANGIERAALNRAQTVQYVGLLLVWIVTGALSYSSATFISTDNF